MPLQELSTGLSEITPLEVGGATTINLLDDIAFSLGTGVTASLVWETADANANAAVLALPTGGATDVPVFAIGETGLHNTDLGLFDGVTQPLVSIFDKDTKLHTATNGIADAGAASAILKHVGGFTAAVVGDIVRITAGTLCTVGWYWITTVTSADQVTLDRNYTSGDTTTVTFVTFHNFPMIGAEGVCLKCFDGAPGDANVEIDRDGWLQLDVSQANGRLYWRANNAWHYVDTTSDALPENSSMILPESLSADGKYSGITEAGVAGATLAFGDVVYQAVGDTRWELAQADATATSIMRLGICVQVAAGNASVTTILLFGKVRADAVFPSFTAYAPVFIDAANAGDLVSTAPATATNVVRCVGQAISADELWFNPDNTWIVVA